MTSRTGNINVSNQMLFSYLPEKNGKYHADKVYIIDETRRCTFREFNEKTNALARGLIKAGVKSGDRVAVFNHNAIENVELFFGIMKADGVAVPVNVRLAPREVLEILQDSDPVLLVAGNEYLSKLPLDGSLYCLRNRYVIGDGENKCPNYDSLFQGCSSERLEPLSQDDNVAMLVYTSGTTGKPKGVMWTHRNLFSSAQASAISRRTRPDDAALIVAPIYQAAGVGTLFSSTFRGNTIVLLNKFDPVEYLATIEREKITTAFLVPAMLLKLLECRDIDRFDLSSMRTICYGSAPMPVEALKRAMDRFGWEFMGACGATETSPGYIGFLDSRFHYLDGSPEMERQLRSIGKESINAEVRIFDDNDRELSSGEVGEIVVRGPNVMKGYWGKPAETAEALRNGWYHTGDLGLIDDQGFIYIVDRKKDMIISGGFNVYPKEIESVLDSHPAIIESAVVGVPDERWGETPVAFIVLKKGIDPPPVQEVMEFLRRELAGYKLPKGGIIYVSELPRNAAGKVLKRELRSKYAENRGELNY